MQPENVTLQKVYEDVVAACQAGTITRVYHDTAEQNSVELDTRRITNVDELESYLNTIKDYEKAIIFETDGGGTFAFAVQECRSLSDKLNRYGSVTYDDVLRLRPYAPEPIFDCSVELNPVHFLEKPTVTLRKKGTNIDLVTVNLKEATMMDGPTLYVDSFFYNLQNDVTNLDFKNAVIALQDAFDLQFAGKKTLAGAAMEWVARAALWMGCDKVELQDAWKSLKSKFTSEDLQAGATAMLDPTRLEAIQGKIKEKARQHKVSDVLELAERIKKGGYYGMWNFEPKFNRIIKGHQYLSDNARLVRTDQRVAYAKAILHAGIRGSFVDLSVASF